MEKIAIITHNMLAGGAERVIAQFANYLSTKNIKCFIIKLKEGEVFYPLSNDITVISIGKKSNNRLFNKLKGYVEVRKKIEFIMPDIILTMPEEVGIFVIPALIGIDIPVVLSERNNPYIMPRNKISRIIRKLFYPFASGFIFQTVQAASFFPKRIQNMGIVLPNPLDLERIPKPWSGPRRKEIVGAGRLDNQKNFSLLINAFSKFYEEHTDYVLIIYGEGSLRKNLEELASLVLPYGSYSFPGKTNNLLEKIKGASIFVLSSDYEGMPNVVIEAMAMGMSVISTDCPSGGPAELIENCINGLLVPVGDVDAMSYAMSKLADSEELRALLGKNAQGIKNRLDSKIVAERWRVYLDAISKKKNTN